MSKRGERETLFIKGRKKVSCNGKVNELGIKGKKEGGGRKWLGSEGQKRKTKEKEETE